MILFSGDDLHIACIDDGGRRLIGVGEQEAVDTLTWPMFMHGEDLPLLLYTVLANLARGDPWRGNMRLRRRDGAEVPVQAFVAPWSSDNGAPAILLGVMDRTDEARLLTALDREQVLLHALLDTIPESVYFKDLESRFLRTSTALARIAGYKGPEDMLGKTDFDFFSDEHASQALRDEQSIIATGKAIIDYEEKETWPDGHVTWASSTKLPLRDPSGRIIGTFGISRDITARKIEEEERRQMEQQLHLAQKMESIGRLAAGIAHEVNTPTQFINDNTHFLQDAHAQIRRVLAAYQKLRSGLEMEPHFAELARETAKIEETAELAYYLEEIPRTLEQTLQGIARIANIVRSLKEFSHPSTPEKRQADLNRAIETAISVTRHEWKYVAEMVSELDDALPMVPCMLDEFNQVLLNLIVNAAHAIGDVVKDSGVKGRITIRTRLDDPWAVIEVVDTGTGIPPEVQPRIFEPFFTTKAIGKGTGQGLAMVQTIIVKKHQGQVGFTTAMGQGTTFRIRLPLATSATASTP